MFLYRGYENLRLTRRVWSNYFFVRSSGVRFFQHVRLLLQSDAVVRKKKRSLFV